MYYIGSLGEKFRPLALMYALLAALSAFGIGNLSQISSAGSGGRCRRRVYRCTGA
ncbi:MAG: hypothetical protein V8S72_05255 [Oscillospiraceae bacterium]